MTLNIGESFLQELCLQTNNQLFIFNLSNVLLRSLLNFIRLQISLFHHIMSHNILNIAFQMFQINRQFILFSSHRVKTIITIPKLNNLLSITSSNCVIIHNCNILNQLDQSSLHVSSIGRLDCCINNTLPTTHCMEEEFSCCQS